MANELFHWHILYMQKAIRPRIGEGDIYIFIYLFEINFVQVFLRNIETFHSRSIFLFSFTINNIYIVDHRIMAI